LFDTLADEATAKGLMDVRMIIAVMNHHLTVMHVLYSGCNRLPVSEKSRHLADRLAVHSGARP